MLFITLKIFKLDGDTHPPEIIVKRLNAIGYIQNTHVDLEKNTISFEYASHRDMDSVARELRKMGLKSFKKQIDSRITKNPETPLA